MEIGLSRSSLSVTENVENLPTENLRPDSRNDFFLASCPRPGCFPNEIEGKEMLIKSSSAS